MDKIIEKLFSGYLSEQNTANNADYSKVAKKALAKEKELRNLLFKLLLKLFIFGCIKELN